ncbi:hypothetical protein [Pleomorphomonas oryzae]|uniref:hypothetical protein n=1 Tax=Pleomorphomonas oryzae TaxID=261934 RepID=UPI00047D4D90|nr:hypothetical protein [Pleomorphomonas oryzae]
MSSELSRPRSTKATVTVALTTAGLVLSACAGREAHPIAATNPSDSVFDCAGIQREFEANERQIQATLKERSAAQGKNVVLGVTGALIFLPALFFMDPKSPEKVEIDALRNRNKVLEDIARSKKCSPPVSQLADVYKKLDAPAPPPPGSSSAH